MDGKVERVGRTVRDWCEAAGFGTTKYYSLPQNERPKTVTIGARDLIIESPREFFERRAREQSTKVAA